MEHPEEAMDQLTEELWTNLKSRTGKIHQSKEEIERLRQKVDSHQKWFVVIGAPKNKNALQKEDINGIIHSKMKILSCFFIEA